MSRERVAGTNVSGREVIAALIRHGALARPRCFQIGAGDSGCTDQARREQPIDFWPILGSGALDLLLSRQFGKRGQCFHFMADTPDSKDDDRDPATGVPSQMAHEAYARCVRLATSLFDEVLIDPFLANARGRGVYVLIHMLTDVFSRAHAERDDRGRILYLKVWILRNDLLFDFRHFDPKLHHRMGDARDRKFIDADRVVDGKKCGDRLAPYEVPPGCLTKDGEDARDAIVDLLVTMYRAFRRGGGGGDKPAEEQPLPVNLEHEQAQTHPENPVSIDDPNVRELWRKFLARHYTSASEPLVIEKQRDSEVGWQPNLMLAALFRIDTAGSGWDTGVREAWVQVIRQALPLVPMEAVTFGVGRFDEVWRWSLRAELSFLIPLWDRLGVGFSPLTLGFGCRWALEECRGDILTVPVRLSYFSQPGSARHPAAIAFGRWDPDFYFDLGAEAQLTLSVSALEVSFGGPRISYVHWKENRGIPLSLRFGWRWRD